MNTTFYAKERDYLEYQALQNVLWELATNDPERMRDGLDREEKALAEVARLKKLLK